MKIYEPHLYEHHLTSLAIYLFLHQSIYITIYLHLFTSFKIYIHLYYHLQNNLYHLYHLYYLYFMIIYIHPYDHLYFLQTSPSNSGPRRGRVTCWSSSQDSRKSKRRNAPQRRGGLRGHVLIFGTMVVAYVIIVHIVGSSY